MMDNKLAHLFLSEEHEKNLFVTITSDIKNITPSPLKVLVGSQRCNEMLLIIEKMIKKPITERDEFNIEEIAKLVFCALPKQDNDQIVGFVLTLAEYLSFVADGSIPYPDFKPSKLHTWQELREFVQCRSQLVDQTFCDACDVLNSTL